MSGVQGMSIGNRFFEAAFPLEVYDSIGIYG